MVASRRARQDIQSKSRFRRAPAICHPHAPDRYVTASNFTLEARVAMSPTLGVSSPDGALLVSATFTGSKSSIPIRMAETMAGTF